MNYWQTRKPFKKQPSNPWRCLPNPFGSSHEAFLLSFCPVPELKMSWQQAGREEAAEHPAGAGALGRSRLLLCLWHREAQQCRSTSQTPARREKVLFLSPEQKASQPWSKQRLSRENEALGAQELVACRISSAPPLSFVAVSFSLLLQSSCLSTSLILCFDGLKFWTMSSRCLLLPAERGFPNFLFTLSAFCVSLAL